MAPAESQEDFYDVPDAVAPLQVAQRWGDGTVDEVLLRWRKPRENAREIQSYEVCWWPWSLGGETREAEASSIQLAAEEVAEGDLCHYPLRATKPERRTPGELLHPAPLTASWVSVRAYNQEGWGDWSRATLVFFREVIGGDARNGYQEADATPGTAGSLLTWGASEDGRLGRGLEVLQRGACPELVAVPGFQECRLSSMAAGAHTCVLSQRDQLYLWGSFLPDGQDSEEVDVLVEPQEQALDFVCHAAACGRFSTVLLSAEGRLFAWGPNEVYQCGIPGDAMVRSLTQLQVPKDEAVIQVELGEFHGVSLTSSGQVLCWGQEQGPEAGLRDEPKLKGLLPESINFNEPSPRALDLPVPVTLVAAGGYHSAFLTQNGQLWSWGSNSHGQLGLGLPTEKAFVGRPRPVVLEGHTGRMAKLSLGGVHSAVLDDAGVAYTFGDNSRGQCGQGDRPHLLAPERVRELPMALGVCCGGFFSFFQVAEDLYACGWGKEGCLGFGRVSKRQLKVLRVPQPPQGRWLQLRAGASHVVALVTGENENFISKDQ